MEMVINTNVLFNNMVKRDGEWSEIATKLQEVRLQLKALDLIESELTEALKELSEGKASYDVAGNTYKPYEVRGKVNYTRIPQLHNIDLEPFRIASHTAWKLGFIKGVQ